MNATDALVLCIYSSAWALYDGEDQLIASGSYDGFPPMAWSEAQKGFARHKRAVKRDLKVSLSSPKWEAAQKRTDNSWLIPA